MLKSKASEEKLNELIDNFNKLKEDYNDTEEILKKSFKKLSEEMSV